jgi:hypothetical protein
MTREEMRAELVEAAKHHSALKATAAKIAKLSLEDDSVDIYGQA